MLKLRHLKAINVNYSYFLYACGLHIFKSNNYIDTGLEEACS